MVKNQGKRALCLDIPIELYNMFAKLCIELGISKTEGVTRYFQYLQKRHHMQRKALDEQSDSDFKLDERKPK